MPKQNILDLDAEQLSTHLGRIRYGLEPEISPSVADPDYCTQLVKDYEMDIIHAPHDEPVYQGLIMGGTGGVLAFAGAVPRGRFGVAGETIEQAVARAALICENNTQLWL